MKFEWDEKKRQQNLEKHGIDFVFILPLFSNPVALKLKDMRRDYGEVRFILFGEINERLFQVVYTLRGEAIRIISARKGNERERLNYEKYTR